MSTLQNCKIVTDGLTLCLDAGNTKSYPGSGTNWSDLSGFKNNGSLINNPSYNSSNSGVIVINGSGDYIRVTNGGRFNVGINNFTICLWVYLPVVASWNYIHLFSFDEQTNWAFKAGDSIYGPGIYFYGGNETYRSYLGSFGNWNIQFGVWQYICISRNGSIHKAYYNGNYVGQYSNTPKSISCTYVNIGVASTPGEYTQQRRGPIQFYNKELTALEVLQNYNATKSRFGL